MRASQHLFFVFAALTFSSGFAADSVAKQETILQREHVGTLPVGLVSKTLRVSPDGNKIAGVLAKDGVQVVFCNDKESPKYEGVTVDSLHFSSDSKRFAYAAKREGKSIAVVDGMEYPAFDGCMEGFPIFSPDNAHFLYVAQRDGKMCVVLDGNPGDDYEAVMKNGIVFSPDGKRVAFAAKEGDFGRMVVDGVAGPAFRNIDAPTFSSDSRNFAYVAISATRSVLFVNGREAVEAENFIRGALSFDTPNRLHILTLQGREVSRVQVDIFAKP